MWKRVRVRIPEQASGTVVASEPTFFGRRFVSSLATAARHHGPACGRG